MYVNELINLLIYKNVPSLLITRKASTGPNDFEIGSTRIHRLSIGPEAQWDKANLIGLNDVIVTSIEDEIQRSDFNPKLIHSIYWYSGMAAISVARKLSIPFIHTIISNGYRKRIAGEKVEENRIQAETKIYSEAKNLIAISNQERQDLMSYYGISSDKIKVVGRGVDDLFLTELFDSKGTLMPKQMIHGRIK